MNINNNTENNEQIAFNRVNWDISEFSPQDFFSMQVVINAYIYQMERNNIGSVYHQSPGYCDLNIVETGVSQKTGYVWIALESGITIASKGGRVKYVATNWLINKEYFFADYDEALKRREEIRKWAKDAYSTETKVEHKRVVR